MLRFFALGLLVLSGAVGAAAVQKTNVQPSADVEKSQSNNLSELSTESAVSLAYRADALKKAFLSGDERTIQDAVAKIDLLRREYGTLDVAPLVEAMCLWARELGNEGKTETGVRVLAEISRWTSVHPALLGAEITLKRQEGFAGYIKSLAPVAKLSRIRLENPDTRYIFLLWHLGWIKTMATIVLWGTAIVLTLRYRLYLRYLLERPIANALGNSFLAAIATGLLLVLPIIIGLDPSFNAFLWLFLLAPTFTPSELKVAIFCISIQLIHPCISLMESKFVNNVFPASIEALQVQPQLISFKARPLNKLSSQDQHFLTGWEALRSRDWKRAEQIFQYLSSQSFEKAATLNNLGVSFHHQLKFDEALEAFVEASMVDPKAVEPIYNQAVIHFSYLNSIEAEKKLFEAKKANPIGYDQIIASISGSEQWTYPMPVKDTPERANALVNSYNETYIDNIDVTQNGPFGAMDVIWIIWPLLGTVGIVIRRNRSIIKYCQCHTCGVIFQAKQVSGQNVCPQCNYYFSLKSAIHTRDRAKKTKEVNKFQSHQKLIYKFLKIVLPGCDSVFLGATVSGFLIFLSTTASIGMIVYSLNKTYYPGEIISDPQSLLLIIGILLCVIIYLRSWIKSFSNSLNGSNE
jgi:tetratricopeptide (TPR) repeat protein